MGAIWKIVLEERREIQQMVNFKRDVTPKDLNVKGSLIVESNGNDLRETFDLTKRKRLPKMTDSDDEDEYHER